MGHPRLKSRTAGGESGEPPLSLIDAIRKLLPETARPGSTEAIFGEPIQAGTVVLIPVARLLTGVVGLDTANQSGLGAGLSLEPVAVVVVRGREVSLRRFAGPAALADNVVGPQLDNLVEAIKPVVRGSPEKTQEGQPAPRPGERARAGGGLEAGDGPEPGPRPSAGSGPVAVRRPSEPRKNR